VVLLADNHDLVALGFELFDDLLEAFDQDAGGVHNVEALVPETVQLAGSDPVGADQNGPGIHLIDRIDRMQAGGPQPFHLVLIVDYRTETIDRLVLRGLLQRLFGHADCIPDPRTESTFCRYQYLHVRSMPP